MFLFTQTSSHVCLHILTRMSKHLHTYVYKWWKWLPTCVMKVIAESLCTCPMTTDAHCPSCHSHKYVHTYIHDTSDSSPRHFSPAIHLHIFTFDSSTHTKIFTHISATQQTHHREPAYLPKICICSILMFGPTCKYSHICLQHIYVYSSSSSSRRFFSPVAARCGDRCVDRWVYIHAWIHNYGYVHGCASLEICVSMSVYICAWTGEYRSMREF